MKKVFEKKDFYIAIPAFILAIFMIIGKEFLTKDSLKAIFFSLSSILQYFLLFIFYFLVTFWIMKLMFHFIMNKYNRSQETKLRDSSIKCKTKTKAMIQYFLRIRNFILNHTFSIWIVIVIAWLPYLIAYYPGIFMGDTNMQIVQANFMNGFNWNSVGTQNPVVHTLMIKLSLMLSNVLHSDNLGLFFYTIFQFLSISFTLAFMVKYTKKLTRLSQLKYLVQF